MLSNNSTQQRPRSEFGRQERWKKSIIILNTVVILTVIIFNIAGSNSVLKALDNSQFHELGDDGFTGQMKIKKTDYLKISPNTHAAPPSLFCLTAEESPTKESKCRRNFQYFAIGMVKSGTAMLKEVASFFSDQIKTHEGFPEAYHFQDQYSPRQRTRFFQFLGYLQNNTPIQPPPENLQVVDNIDFIYGAHSPNQIYLTEYRYCYFGQDKDCNPNADENANVTAIIHLIRQLLPRETLLIAALRDPTKRAVSHFSHFSPKCPDLWHGKEDKAKCFHDYVLAEIQQLQTCLQFSSRKIDCVMLPFDQENKGLRLVGIGLYAILLQMWLEHFPNFCLMDVIHKDWLEVGRDLGDCLGVTLQPPFNKTYKYEAVSMTSKNKQKPWNVTLDILDHFYAPYNRQLCQIAPNTCQWGWVQKSMELLH